MTKEKSQLKEFIEAVSVFQWTLSFVFMGKVSLSLPFAHLVTIMSMS